MIAAHKRKAGLICRRGGITRVVERIGDSRDGRASYGELAVHHASSKSWWSACSVKERFGTRFGERGRGRIKQRTLKRLVSGDPERKQDGRVTWVDSD